MFAKMMQDEAVEMAQLVEPLLTRRKDPSVSTQSPHNNLGAEAHACNPSTGKADRKISRACWLPVRNPVSERKRR